MSVHSNPSTAADDAAVENPAPGRVPWVADNGDGTYRNPVLHADYSDPDAIRVGDDYWMTASSFSHVPGLPILHSRDLVNWRLVNHALPRLVPAEHFSIPRPGEGVWAPSIRHHDGRFWIFYPDPDFGLYVITTDDPAGAWSEPILVKAGRGLIDPCPLWDDDGQTYLVHAWARSRAGINNLLTVHRMAPDGSRLLDDGEVVIDANQMPGWRTLEGPKLYKRDGWYWIFAPAGGVTEGYQAVFRARDIFGPYEERIVLEQGSTPINGPHQGAWVDTPAGDHWFLHFQDAGPYGRITHLQPMKWRDDGWPVMGVDENHDGTGEPVLRHARPELPRQPVAVPPTSDDFKHSAPGLQWQWQANPRPGWISLDAPEGVLRLRCVPLAQADSHWVAPHLLLQKFPALEFSATTRLRFAPSADGDTAGLMVFGYDYAWLGLRRTASGTRLVLVRCEKAQERGRETETASVEMPQNDGIIHLRVEVEDGGLCRFSWSADGSSFTSLGAPFQATVSRWVGAKVGIFASAAPGHESAGVADFAAFEVR
jgi:beta-xylosidase